MREGITRLTYQQISQRWAEKVRELYEGMNTAQDIEELIEFLKNPAYTITFRYALCRFLREKYGITDGEGKVYISHGSFQAFFTEDLQAPLPEEVENYVQLMVLLAGERGMKDQIQGKLLRRYLLGKQDNVSRETLFKMAFAFDMDCETVCELLESLDEVPYQYRDPWECICYYCQYSEETNYWAEARKLWDEWKKIEEETNKGQNAELFEGQTQMIADGIAELHFEEEDPGEREKQFLNYLREHASDLTGYSLSAYRVLEELMEDLKELTGAEDDTDLSIRLWEPIWVQYCTKKADRTGVNRSDFVPFKDLLDLPGTLYEKPLWRARIQKLKSRRVPVEKRDILFLNAMKWAMEGESEGGLDAMNDFVLETNGLLSECGLAMIYPPNPYDRMILLSICSDSPYDVLSDIFQTATDEEKLNEKLKERSKEK